MNLNLNASDKGCHDDQTLLNTYSNFIIDLIIAQYLGLVI